MLYLIIPNIRSAHNVGSFFRTADAFGVDKIFLCGYTPVPPHPRVDKVSLGAEKTVPFEYHKDAWRVVEKLKKEGVQIIAAELTKKSVDYRMWKPKKSVALILGNEVEGVPQNLLKRADKTVHIPMMGQKESLNVSVAAGILCAYVRMK